MRGKRLIKANEIAKKRTNRDYDGLTWYKMNWYKLRKWNGSCSCWACSKPRYKDKGSKKEKYKLLKTIITEYLSKDLEYCEKCKKLVCDINEK